MYQIILIQLHINNLFIFFLKKYNYDNILNLSILFIVFEYLN